jgi:hypothetical protein
MVKRKVSILLVVILSFLSVLGMVACSPDTPSEELPPTVETSDATAGLKETEVLPSPSPLPEMSVVVLAVGEGAHPWTVERVQAVVEDLASQSNLALVVEEALVVESLGPDVKILVGVTLADDTTALAALNPNIAFVFVDQEGATPGGNQNLIGDPVYDQQRQSFLAGYLAALVSSDYKVAALIPSDQNLSTLMAEAFSVGVEFYCGICRPVTPPFQNFPQREFLPTENATDGYQPVINALIENGVEILYLQNQLASPEILTYLNEKDVKIVGDQPIDILRGNWVGTVLRDPGPALIELWPSLLLNGSGVQIPSAITVTDTEAGLISTGKMRFIGEIVEELEAGLISLEPKP